MYDYLKLSRLYETHVLYGPFPVTPQYNLLSLQLSRILMYFIRLQFSCMHHVKCDDLSFVSGESGAGKTENTKKVISYFAQVAAQSGKKDEEPVEDKKVTIKLLLEVT